MSNLPSKTITQEPDGMARFLEVYSKGFALLKNYQGNKQAKTEDIFFLTLFSLACKVMSNICRQNQPDLLNYEDFFNKIKFAYEKYKNSELISFSTDSSYTLTNPLIFKQTVAMQKPNKTDFAVSSLLNIDTDIRFTRHAVNADGDCGYTAFGIDRTHAYQLLSNNLNQIQTLLQPAIKECLLTEAFINYLKDQEYASSGLLKAFSQYQQAAQQSNNIDAAIEQLYRYGNDLVILSGYLAYDIHDKQVDAGWSHPAILQALADIQHIELYIWEPGSGQQVIPHQHYSHYSPKQVNERIDLFFIHDNHFERLEIVEPTLIEQNAAKNERIHESYTSKKQQVIIEFKASYDGFAYLMQLQEAIKKNQAALAKLKQEVAELNSKIKTVTAAQKELKKAEKSIIRMRRMLILTAGTTTGLLFVGTTVNLAVLIATLGTSSGANGATAVLLSVSAISINSIAFFSSLVIFLDACRRLQKTLAQCRFQKTQIDEQFSNYVERINTLSQSKNEKITLTDFTKLLTNTQNTIGSMKQQTNNQIAVCKQAQAKNTTKTQHLSQTLCELKIKERENMKKFNRVSGRVTAFDPTFFARSKQDKGGGATDTANNDQSCSLTKNL